MISPAGDLRQFMTQVLDPRGRRVSGWENANTPSDIRHSDDGWLGRSFAFYAEHGHGPSNFSLTPNPTGAMSLQDVARRSAPQLPSSKHPLLARRAGGQPGRIGCPNRCRSSDKKPQDAGGTFV